MKLWWNGVVLRGEKQFPVPLVPQHITCGLCGDRSPASAVTGVEDWINNSENLGLFSVRSSLGQYIFYPWRAEGNIPGG
jgi:hypothetical protein